MRLVLTGATGLLGNNVARLALAAGYHVVCPVRRPDDRSLRDLAVESVVMDAAVAAADWEGILAGADAVIHSAAMIHIGWTQQEASYSANVQWTERLGMAARRVGCRLVHISTVDTLAYSVDGQGVTENQRQPAKPASAYVRSKTAAEQVVHSLVDQGLDAVILHPGFMLGPWDWKPSSGKMLQAIARGQIPLVPAGGCSAVDVRDVARGVLSAIERGVAGEHYILAGHNLSYRELFREMASVVGSRPPRLPLGPGIAWMAGQAGDLWTKLSRRETDLNSAMVRMGQLRHFYSSEKAAQGLGYGIGPLLPAIQAAWDFLRAPSDPPS